jgi:phosphatidylinositol kinase/protein kinase (PI-3  family)
LKSIVGE